MRKHSLHVVRSLQTCTRVLYFFVANPLSRYLNGGNMKKFIGYFSALEKTLWLVSVVMIVVSFFLFDGSSPLTLAASLVGVTSLIFNAKGNPAGQALMIAFSILYGIISFSVAYYGEMLTYVGMTMPMAIFSLVSWLKNPYNGKKSQVKINSLSGKEVLLMCLAAIAVTAGFYFILDYFDTANIIPSTISVTTSFVAVYLTFRRSPFFALGYAANDVVLLVLWISASVENVRYVSTVICFVAFLFNDLYGFICWQKTKKLQAANDLVAEKTV